MTTLLIEMRDGLTGELEYVGDAAAFRESNYDDVEVLAAIERLERGESEREIVGFSKLVAVRLAEVRP